MANNADRMFIVPEFLRMAGRARNVAREFRRSPVVVSNVADEAGHPFMLGRIVPEPGIVLDGGVGGRLVRDGGHCFGFGHRNTF